MYIIVKKSFQPHYNNALGKVITSEKQYKEEIKRGGYISYDECKERVEASQEKRKQFAVSDDAKDWMRGVQDKADDKGNVKLSDREIEAMKDRGMSLEKTGPTDTPVTGGFDNA